MTGQAQTIRQYLGDLIAVIDHVAKAMSAQDHVSRFAAVPGAASLIERTESVLVRHRAALESRVNSMGEGNGVTLGGAIKDAVTTIAGSLAGLYGKTRDETASRMLRDDYTALNFLAVCTTMLHTTALALNDSVTADLTRQHLHDYPRLVMDLNDLVPHAVVADLLASKVAVTQGDAARQAVAHVHEAWASSSVGKA